MLWESWRSLTTPRARRAELLHPSIAMPGRAESHGLISDVMWRIENPRTGEREAPDGSMP